MLRYFLCFFMYICLFCKPVFCSEKNITTQIMKLDNTEICLYIKINKFEKNTYSEVYDILEKNDTDELIIDLRNNKGGVLNQAVDIAKLFVENGIDFIKVVYENGEENNFCGNGKYTDKTVVVLVNSLTASAAEALSLSLGENGAYLIGEITYGKNSIQKVAKENEKITKYTVGKYFVNDLDIENIGIKPDLLVFNENNLYFDAQKNQYKLVERDVQLEKAVEYVSTTVG